MGASEKLFQQAVVTCRRRSPHPFTCYAVMLQRLLQKKTSASPANAGAGAAAHAASADPAADLVKYAVGLYREALGIDPLDPDALTSCAALSAFCTGEGGVAEAMLERAVLANPAHPSALCNYGQLLLNKGFSALADLECNGDDGGSSEQNAFGGQDGMASAGAGGKALRWVVVERPKQETEGNKGDAVGGKGGSAVREVDVRGDEDEEEVEAEPEDLMRRGVEALERALRKRLLPFSPPVLASSVV